MSSEYNSTGAKMSAFDAAYSNGQHPDAAMLRLLLCSTLLLACANALPLADNGTFATYDQRQTGDYNIHISLKDIKIVALLSGGLGGSEDYDYNYDYAEMTIKPSPGENSNNTNSSTTTLKPDISSITEINAQNISSATTEQIVEITPHSQTTTTVGNTLVIENGTNYNKNKTAEVKPVKKPDNNQNIPVQIVLTPVEILSDALKPANTTDKITTTASPNATKRIKQANCIDGFVKDRQGNCRPRARKPQQQSLLRKLIQLSQKAQLPKL